MTEPQSEDHVHWLKPIHRAEGGFYVMCSCGAYLAKEGLIVPKTSPNPLGLGGEKPKETVGDAIQYATENPSGFGYLVEAGKWLVGFFAALFRPAMKKP